MGLFLLCLGLFGSSFLFYWLGKAQARKAQTLKLTAASTVSQLTEICASVAQELGPGSFRQTVKIRGKASSPGPLVSEITHTPCLGYTAKVIREFEVLVWEKDSEGREMQRRQRQSEVLASNQRSITFFLDDGTGIVEVHPEGAQIDTRKTRSDFQPAHSTLSIGSFQIDFSSMPGGTLGYRYEEEILPLDEELSLVAEASDLGGKLVLRKPEDKDNLFLISPRSFEDLASGSKSLQSLFYAVSIGIAILGAGTLLLGVIR